MWSKVNYCFVGKETSHLPATALLESSLITSKGAVYDLVMQSVEVSSSMQLSSLCLSRIVFVDTCPSGTTVIPDPMDSYGYLRCVKGVPLAYTCPSHQKFVEAKKNCLGGSFSKSDKEAY
jgi:hypothetical protein